MRKHSQTKEQIEKIIELGNEYIGIKIVSGEGDCGTEEDYEGDMTAHAVMTRLSKEKKGGRWAYIDTYEGHYVMGQI